MYLANRRCRCPRPLEAKAKPIRNDVGEVREELGAIRHESGNYLELRDSQRTAAIT
jgi:hypothetical protein